MTPFASEGSELSWTSRVTFVYLVDGRRKADSVFALARGWDYVKRSHQDSPATLERKGTTTDTGAVRVVADERLALSTRIVAAGDIGREVGVY